VRTVHPSVRAERAPVSHGDSPCLIRVNVLSMPTPQTRDVPVKGQSPSASCPSRFMTTPVLSRIGNRTKLEPSAIDVRAPVISPADNTITRASNNYTVCQ